MLNTVNRSLLICIVIETSTKQDMIEVLERKLMGDTQGGALAENERKEKETLIYQNEEMKTELAVREARIAELEKKVKEAGEPKANPMQNMIGEALKKKISELEEKLTEAQTKIVSANKFDDFDKFSF